MAFAALIVVGLLGAIPPLARHLPAQLPGWGGALVMAGILAREAAQVENAWTALAVTTGGIAAALATAAAVFSRQEL
jgi:hypothetical protein